VSDDGPDRTASPTWADLFARGEAVGATEAEVRDALRSRRDD
jgi:hypothetical protein